jgi:hypothetical protein
MVCIGSIKPVLRPGFSPKPLSRLSVLSAPSSADEVNIDPYEEHRDGSKAAVFSTDGMTAG